MRTAAIALSILLSATTARAATAPSPWGDPAPAAEMAPGIMQLAGSPNKLGDKFMAGRAGGRYGIGGTESKIFKKKK